MVSDWHRILQGACQIHSPVTRRPARPSPAGGACHGQAKGVSLPDLHRIHPPQPRPPCQPRHCSAVPFMRCSRGSGPASFVETPDRVVAGDVGPSSPQGGTRRSSGAERWLTRIVGRPCHEPRERLAHSPLGLGLRALLPIEASLQLTLPNWRRRGGASEQRYRARDERARGSIHPACELAPRRGRSGNSECQHIATSLNRCQRQKLVESRCGAVV
jgi:hypothetical protein